MAEIIAALEKTLKTLKKELFSTTVDESLPTPRTAPVPLFGGKEQDEEPIVIVRCLHGNANAFLQTLEHRKVQ